LYGRSRPSVRLDAEHIQRDGLAVSRNNAISTHNAVLLPAGDDFAGQQKQRSIRVIDQSELIDPCAALRNRERTFAPYSIVIRPRPHQARRLTRLRYGHLPGADSFIERQKSAGVEGLVGNHRKDGQITLPDCGQDLIDRLSPFACEAGEQSQSGYNHTGQAHNPFLVETRESLRLETVCCSLFVQRTVILQVLARTLILYEKTRAAEFGFTKGEFCELLEEVAAGT